MSHDNNALLEKMSETSKKLDSIIEKMDETIRILTDNKKDDKLEDLNELLNRYMCLDKTDKTALYNEIDRDEFSGARIFREKSRLPQHQDPIFSRKTAQTAYGYIDSDDKPIGGEMVILPDYDYQPSGHLPNFTRVDNSLDRYFMPDFGAYSSKYQPTGYMNASRACPLPSLKDISDFSSLYPSVMADFDHNHYNSIRNRELIRQRCRTMNIYLSNKPDKNTIREEIIIHNPDYNLLHIYTNHRAITNIVIILYQMKVPLMPDIYRYIMDALGIPKDNQRINLTMDDTIAKIIKIIEQRKE